MDKNLKVRWWIVGEEDLPKGEERRIDWLFEHWGAIDKWVEANKPSSAKS
jgi:hypothetical protein